MLKMRSFLPAVAEQLFRDIKKTYQETSQIPDDLLIALKFVFGPCALQALDLVDQHSVTCLLSPSGRKAFQSFQFPRILVCGVDPVDRGQSWPCSSWRLTEKYSRESQHFRQRQSFAEALTLTVPSVAATEWQILMYSVVLRKPASLPATSPSTQPLSYHFYETFKR
ncbi:zinc finger SWIM domain-containing protein 7 isoform X1 [Sander vitreus]